ncbi:MarR family winged helix-turn-helix transcriptional regulator [Frankia sp. Cas3]|uniref:MarR family winged helix-turn-helix transcriptional regulator n=1 Tax=Frankia sp. Cas3 TaxID=3073926 RepID=UPI002AD46300|nr:MarR family winged helix-turn-helix transcriptional regulator [Frankia sp. Cas3]
MDYNSARAPLREGRNRPLTRHVDDPECDGGGSSAPSTQPAPSALQPDGPRAEPANLAAHPGHLARRLQQVTYQLWNAVVSDETTPPQFAVLNCLLAEPGVDQKTVGERASLDRSNVADVVARLVQRGLVRRLRNPADGRRNVLRLTRHGEAVHATVARRADAMNEIILGPLTPDEQATFLTLLARIVAASTDRSTASDRVDGEQAAS